MDITDAALHTALADRLSAQAVALCLDAARNARLCGTRDQWNEMARIALAFVAERLPANVLTSEDHAAIQLVIHDQADNRPSSISLTGTLLGIVDRLDALLHDLRGRLGGKS